MYAFCTNVKRLMLTLFVVFLLVGCIVLPKSPRTYSTIYDPQCCPTQGSARIITKEESIQITRKTRTDIIEVTNNQFKIQVYFESSSIVMRLIVPAGEELFIKESFVKIFDAENKQELNEFDVSLSWLREDAQYGEDTGRLVGLMSLPPATVYIARRNLVYVEGEPPEVNYISVKLPVFRAQGNETIIFSDVRFKISITIEEYKGDYYVVPLCC